MVWEECAAREKPTSRSGPPRFLMCVITTAPMSPSFRIAFCCATSLSASVWCLLCLALPAPPLPRHRCSGKLADNEVVMAHPSVSRSHALLVVDRSLGAFLVDLGASNGSFVDGRVSESEPSLYIIL